MNDSRHLLPVLVFVALLAPGPTLQAQTAPPESAISRLAGHIAEPLQKANVTKVIFADLKGPNREVHPIGRWLADQLANACNRDFPSLEVMLRPVPGAENTPEFQNDPPKSVEDWARRVGANVVVQGTFTRLANGLGISLVALTSTDPPETVGAVTDLLPITSEMLGLSPQPIPAPINQIPRAGIGGVGIPESAYCPPPRYSSEARKAKLQAPVVLQVTVTPEGRAINITVVRDPGKGLGKQAADAVRKWKFKPALGPGKKPVAVVVPIEVTFRLY